MSGLDGKVVLVTGGGSGIGRATALAFAAEGSRVVVVDLRLSDLEETVAMVRKAGGTADAGIDQRCSRVAVANIHDRHRGAFSRECLGVVTANSGRTARNNRGLAFKFAHSDSSKTQFKQPVDLVASLSLPGLVLGCTARVG